MPGEEDEEKDKDKNDKDESKEDAKGKEKSKATSSPLEEAKSGEATSGKGDNVDAPTKIETAGPTDDNGGVSTSKGAMTGAAALGLGTTGGSAVADTAVGTGIPQPTYPENDQHFKLLNRRVLEGHMKLSQDFFRGQAPPAMATIVYPPYPPRKSKVSESNQGLLDRFWAWLGFGGAKADAEDVPAVSMSSRRGDSVQFVPVCSSLQTYNTVGSRMGSLGTQLSARCPHCSHPMTSHHPECPA